MAERTYIPLQPWSCDKCGKRGDVEVPTNLTIVDRVDRVTKDHQKHSPECARLNWGAFLRFGQIAAQLPD